jgi:acetyl esterase/lipase
MSTEITDYQRRAAPVTEAAPTVKDVRISWRSRFITWLFRVFLKPMLARVVGGSNARIARWQLFLAGQVCRQSYGLALDYGVLGRVPGHAVGALGDTSKPAILYLHGGAFILPAVPDTHVRMLAQWCRDLDAVGFMADYRLAPANKFPAALDDCEHAYRGLLDLGHRAERIAIAGESAGGMLLLGLLQRIRKAGLPMPACGIPISAAAELGRIHGPPSRAIKRNSDAILDVAALSRIKELYGGDWDTSDPELSPLFADLRGFPPLYFLCSAEEVVLDESVLLARRARAAGVETRLDIWPVLPHAFPLFERVYPEVRLAREDIVAYIRARFAASSVPAAAVRAAA